MSIAHELVRLFKYGSAQTLQVAAARPWQLSTLGVLVLLAAVIYVYWYWPTWKVRHIPGPPLVFGIGHIHLLEKHGAPLFISLKKQYGPIFRFHLGRQPLVMVAEAELCRQLTVKQHKLAPNRAVPPYIECIEVQKQGLFFTKDAEWVTKRNVLLPLFHKPALMAMQPVMMEHIDTLCSIVDEHAKADESFNMSELVDKLSLDVVGETSFGTKLNQLRRELAPHSDSSDPDATLASTVMQAISLLKLDKGAPLSTFFGMTFPILQHPVHNLLNKIPGTKDYTQRVAHHELCRRMDELAERRRQDTKEQRESRFDALSLLLNAQDNDKVDKTLLKPGYVTALAYEQLLAGSETTSVGACNALYSIAQNPEVERKVLQEIDAFGPPPKEPTPHELDTAFPYLDLVLKETLRLHTTVPMIAREASQPMTLNGYHIPKGTWVWMASNVPQLDEVQYPQPYEFRPERMDPNCEEEKKRHPYSYLAFGAGPRMCIGLKFSQQEMKLILIKLYQRFTFKHSPLMENPLAITLGVIAKPKYGIQLVAHRRHT